jgi:hypothetical protein
LKLPGKFEDRDDCPRMAGRGWETEEQLPSTVRKKQTIVQGSGSWR